MAEGNTLGRAYVEEFLNGITKNWTIPMEEIISALDEASTRIREQAWDMVSSFARAAAQLAPLTKKSEAIRRINERLEPHGWFVPPSLPDELRDSIAHLLDEKDAPRAAVATLLGACSGHVGEEVVERACGCWVMTDRGGALRESLEAHKAKMYFASVPILISQVEGAYRDWLAATGNLADSPFNKMGVQALKQISDILTFSDVILYEHLGAFANAIPNQLGATVNTQADLVRFKEKYPFGFLSRHAVMHGIDREYGTEQNSAKALLVLDLAVGLFQRFDLS